jgi:hypothetical protein
MTDFNDTAAQAETFYDHSEVREAMNDPRYRTSARYRDELAAKLHRSQQAGTVARQSQYYDHRQRVRGRERNPAWGNPDANSNGFTQPDAVPEWAEAAKVGQAGSFFKTPEEIMQAMSAPHFDTDTSYRLALKDKIDRSIREGYVTSDFQLGPRSQGPQ